MTGRIIPAGSPEPPLPCRFVTYVAADPEDIVFRRELLHSPSWWAAHGRLVERGGFVPFRTLWPFVGLVAGHRFELEDVTGFMLGKLVRTVRGEVDPAAPLPGIANELYRLLERWDDV